MSKETELAQFHAEWLQHPITQELKRVLSNLEKEAVTGIAKYCNADDTSLLKQYGQQLNVIKTHQQIIFNTEEFVNQVFPKEQPKVQVFEKKRL